MKASRVLLSGLAALSMTIAAAPADAKAKPGAARKLTLAGAQGASECITRPGEDGKWRQDAAGKWVRCNPVGGVNEGDGGIGTGYLIAGAAAAAGVGVAVALGGTDKPSSP